MNAKKQTVYIAPPKLQKQFLLAGLSVPDIGIMLLLFFSMILLGRLIYAIAFPLCYGAFVARMLDDKSIRDYLLIFLRYHFDAQQYTRHIEIIATKRKEGRKNESPKAPAKPDRLHAARRLCRVRRSALLLLPVFSAQHRHHV